MKLYYSKGACSLVVRIIINELNLKSDYEAVDLKSKKTATDADFLKINPKGAVPTLEIKPSEVLTENAVILQYLADSNHADQLLPKHGDFNRYRVLEWLNFITTELHKGFGPLFNPIVPQDVKENIFVANLDKKFAYVDQQLQGKQYLFGDHFTLPDPYLFVMLRWAKAMKIDLSKRTNLVRFYENLLTRPSIKKSLDEEGIAIK